MVEVNIAGQRVIMDGFLKQKLDNVLKIQSKNYDAVILVDGLERVGKSTLGLTMAAYLYPKMSIKNIAIDCLDAIKKIEDLPDKSLLLVDEGSLVFSSKDSLKKEQRRLLKILNVVGQKNMIFIIVLPSFFELNKYIATTRARFLLHCYADRSLKRGRFCYWGSKKLQRLYMNGKKNYGTYNWPKADFVGRFPVFQPSWYREYLEFKRKTLMTSMKEGKSGHFELTENEILTKWMLIFKENCPEARWEDLCKGFGISLACFHARKAVFLKRYDLELLKSGESS